MLFRAAYIRTSQVSKSDLLISRTVRRLPSRRAIAVPFLVVVRSATHRTSRATKHPIMRSLAHGVLIAFASHLVAAMHRRSQSVREAASFRAAWENMAADGFNVPGP